MLFCSLYTREVKEAEILNNKSVKYEYQEPRQISAMARLVIKSGIAKSEKQANHLLFGLAVVLLILAIFMVTDLFSKKQKIIQYERYEDLPAEVRAQMSRELYEDFRPNK